jgi:hypothetical protein
MLGIAIPADAHNFALIPDNFYPAAGSSRLYGTFTHVVGDAQYSFGFASNMFTVGELKVDLYNNGSLTPIGNGVADFTEYLYDTKTPAADPAAADCSSATFSVPDANTTVLLGKFVGSIDMSQYGGSGISTSASLTKTMLNLTNDGTATKRLGGDGVLEVVFAGDVPADGIKKGAEVTFRFYLGGAPLSGATVYASYAGNEIHDDPEEGPVNDEYLHKTTNANGEATFTLDHADTWFVWATDTTDPANGYSGGVLFDVASPGSGGGGCSAGAGLWGSGLLLGFGALAGLKIRGARDRVGE